MTATLDSDEASKTTATVKFLYSYGGKILPRRTDGMLRYVGGFTRILCVDRSITFAELMVRFGELCGSSMRLKCKLPNEDLDVLVSITSDKDLVDIIEEYDRASSATRQDLKIRAILFPLESVKKISPPPSVVSSVSFPTPKPPPYAVVGHPNTAAATAYGYSGRNSSRAVGFSIGFQKNGGRVSHCPWRYGVNERHLYHVPAMTNLRC